METLRELDTTPQNDEPIKPRKQLAAGFRPQGEIGRRTPNELKIEKFIKGGFSRRAVELACQTILFEGTARQILDPSLRFTESEQEKKARVYNTNHRGSW